MVDARSTEQAAQPGPRASDDEPAADTGKLHERVIADYQRAYVAANNRPAPRIAYERGWYRFRDTHSFARYRRSQIEKLTANLIARAKPEER